MFETEVADEDVKGHVFFFESRSDKILVVSSTVDKFLTVEIGVEEELLLHDNVAELLEDIAFGGLFRCGIWRFLLVGF